MTGTHHIPGLDGVRGLALLTVFACHTYPVLLLGGQIGVDLFFVLSGFLITGILLREAKSTGGIGFKNFYIRRALRLFPALFAMVLIVVVYVALFRKEELHRTLLDAGSIVGYFYNWVRVWAVTDPSIGLQHHFGHLWSLSVEEQFYILWPVLLFAAFRMPNPKWSVLALIVAGIIYPTFARLFLQHSLPTLEIYFRTDLRIDVLMWGALGAWLVVFDEAKRIKIPAVIADISAVAAFVILMAIASYDVAYNGWLNAGGYVPVGFLTAFLIVAVAMGWSRIATWFFDLGFMRWTGKISYGLYIWHLPVFWFAFKAPYALPIPSVIAVVATYIVAALSFYLYEQPFLRLKDRFATKKPAQTALA